MFHTVNENCVNDPVNAGRTRTEKRDCFAHSSQSAWMVPRALPSTGTELFARWRCLTLSNGRPQGFSFFVAVPLRTPSPFPRASAMSNWSRFLSLEPGQMCWRVTSAAGELLAQHAERNEAAVTARGLHCEPCSKNRPGVFLAAFPLNWHPPGAGVPGD